MAPRFEAVIFDCDGVLVDSEALGVAAELELLSACGLTYTQREFVERFVGSPDTDFFAALDADSRARLGRPLRADFPEVVSRARHEAWRGELGEVPGASRAIAPLDLPKAVASSSHAELLEEKLRLTDLWRLFAPHVYSTDLVDRGKPAPDLFLYAARALGVEPARCLVVEDSLNGVRAGLAAGMTVWGFTGGGHCDDGYGERLRREGAERVVESWDDFAAP